MGFMAREEAQAARTVLRSAAARVSAERENALGDAVDDAAIDPQGSTRRGGSLLGTDVEDHVSHLVDAGGPLDDRGATMGTDEIRRHLLERLSRSFDVSPEHVGDAFRQCRAGQNRIDGYARTGKALGKPSEIASWAVLVNP